MPKKTDFTLLEKYIRKHPVLCDFHHEWKKKGGLMVVIPVYREQDWINETLESIMSCDEPECEVGVVLVFNASEYDSHEVVSGQKASAEYIRNNYHNRFPKWMHLFIMEEYSLPKKHFGAGLARKIGMDAAAYCFLKAEDPDGVIVTLDADTTVSPNYFTALRDWFSNPANRGASIYYEHPLDGHNFPDEVYEGITLYELHLRYYLQAHRYAGFPYSYHTMGSAMALRAVAYAKIGGMPKKQAGEDFYFLQKLIPLGGFGDLNTTTVFPSPRPSDRVIFGTGAAITSHVDGSDYIGKTYHIQAFEDVKLFFERKNEFYNLSPDKLEEWSYEFSGPVRSFLLNYSVLSDLQVIKKDCSSVDVFSKRFFEVFNAFKMVKYLNYTHEHFFEKMPVFDASLALLEIQGHSTDEFMFEKELLDYFRKLEKG
ncbi:glycosyltransferase [Alkalitalea saponilacus]|uniref:Glycosyltransferase like family 2 n=1 Tax=Alkalitalea saponilacus TaxID=889453 RepID=A0A1T5BQ01_9BACT|nr:glycosyltransferase family A protein [Alkalitalea saponilacus]ASB49630.1 family 2 glycosyl transferase [Alkalitalea saponilacus]SKB49306.1 Glycosyltransferase like family 2 [Alkalitalea saponilacus]